jgi:hypothetical protein
MRDLFMCLLMNLTNHGNITQANMFGPDYTTIMLVDGEDEYYISITKSSKTEE